MTITRRLVQTAGLVAGAIAAIAATKPDTTLGRAARRLGARFQRDVRYAAASAPGVAYRLAGRRPDPDVSDDILADRIRSSLGPLEKRLDVPHVHVMVEDRVALVHGDVPDAGDARTLEHAVARVSGVRGVESHLHAGLTGGETRPSEGKAAAHHASEALHTLLLAARDAGAGDDPRAAVHAVLCGFTDRIPEDERRHVLAHLPADVRSLAGPARRHGTRPPRLKTLPELVAAVTSLGGVEPEHTEEITRAVLATLRSLVPDEARDVAAVLPPELRELWETEAAH